MEASLLFGAVILVVFAIVQALKPGRSLFE